jgi:hypothetical protein
MQAGSASCHWVPERVISDLSILHQNKTTSSEKRNPGQFMCHSTRESGHGSDMIQYAYLVPTTLTARLWLRHSPWPTNPSAHIDSTVRMLRCRWNGVKLPTRRTHSYMGDSCTSRRGSSRPAHENHFFRSRDLVQVRTERLRRRLPQGELIR